MGGNAMKFFNRFVTACILGLSLCVFTTNSAEAQDKKDQDDPAKVEGMMEMMGPMMGLMMQNMLDGMLTYMSKPETAEKLATFSKNYYDALLKKGFTKEEAMKIITSINVLSMPAMN